MKKINELFFMRPWAVKEDLISRMAEVVARHMDGKKLSREEIDAVAKKEPRAGKPDYEVKNGVAVINVSGVISKRMSLIHEISPGSGTSVEMIKKNIKAAMEDAAVKSIALNVDSPGGSVDGVPELSDYIFGLRGKKKITAYADGQMDSAAYWIGSAAEKIYSTKSSEVGSIGVYSVMTDWSVANHNEGVKREVIKAGRHKATGHPDKPMTAEDRQVVQDEVNEYYRLFTDAVARNRGMAPEDIEKVATGKVFIGSQALDAGLIDGIMDIDSVLEGSEDAMRVEEQAAGITAGNDQEQQQQEEETMDLKALTLDELKVARPDLLVAVANDAKAAGLEEGKAAAEKEALAKSEAESARVTGILKAAQTIGNVGEAALECITKGEKVEDAEKSMKAAKLDSIAQAAPAPLGGGNSSDASQIEASEIPVEEKAEKLWALESTKKEFSSKEALLGYLKGQQKGQIRIFQKSTEFDGKKGSLKK